MKKITLTVLGLTLCSTYSFAEGSGELNKDTLGQCQSISDGTGRLACYDKLLPQKKVAPDQSDEVKDVGKWSVSTKTSPVDDSKNVFLVLNANEPIRGTFGGTVTPTLFVTCREKKTEVFLNWDVYLGLDETTMLYRLDKQKAVKRSWSISTDTKAVFYSGKNIDFIKGLMKADNMFVQITPYNESPVTTSFDLRGLSEAVKPLQKACGWK